MYTDRHAAALTQLDAHGQDHLLTFYNGLDDASKDKLLTQIEAINWESIHGLIDSHVKAKPEFELPANLEPAPYYPYEPTGDLVKKYAKARELGEKQLRAGKVAAFVVAGGSGTRLGWNGPKGTFPATPIQGKPLFQVFAEYIRKVEQKYSTTVPWYVMTSPANDAATREFFKSNSYFGLSASNVIFFAQGTMPSIGYDGKVVLGAQDGLALSADGHGGSLRALYKSGAIEDMDKRGVEQLSYFQVDNPNVKLIDPLFIGLHVMDESQMSSKMFKKQFGKEKLGNFCLIDGRMTVVEYSDLPDDLAEARDGDGELKFRAGSPAIHVIDVSFVRELNSGGDLKLPYHRADKKVPYVDIDTGQHKEPSEPNAVKLEQFVFDALPLAKKSIILETLREEEMAFIKNAEGADSPASSKQLQSTRAARWLKEAGVDVPFKDDGMVDAVIELTHLTAIEPADLQGVNLPDAVVPGSSLDI